MSTQNAKERQNTPACKKMIETREVMMRSRYISFIYIDNESIFCCFEVIYYSHVQMWATVFNQCFHVIENKYKSDTK